MCYGLALNVRLLEDPVAIARKAPAYLTPREALTDAHDAIQEYYEKWMPGLAEKHAGEPSVDEV